MVEVIFDQKLSSTGHITSAYNKPHIGDRKEEVQEQRVLDAYLLKNTHSTASYVSPVHSNVSTVDSYSSLCDEPMYQLLEKTSEDDYDTDVELDGKPGETVTAEQVYRRACEEIGVSPISYYIRHHHDAHLNLNYRCMSPKAVKALSVALVTNTAVTTLDLEHDGINAEGVQYLMEMLVENCFIQTLRDGPKLDLEPSVKDLSLREIEVKINSSMKALNCANDSILETSRDCFLVQGFQEQLMEMTGIWILGGNEGTLGVMLVSEELMMLFCQTWRTFFFLSMRSWMMRSFLLKQPWWFLDLFRPSGPAALFSSITLMAASTSSTSMGFIKDPSSTLPVYGAYLSMFDFLFGADSFSRKHASNSSFERGQADEVGAPMILRARIEAGVFRLALWRWAWSSEFSWTLSASESCESTVGSQMNLSNNELRTWGVEVLCKMLPLNISLKCIKLSGNKLKCNDASYFAETLSSNFRISELDLSYNQFGDKGAEFLGQMLATNESLEILNLQWNQIQTEGAVALSAGLRMNITLKVLDLSYNGFGNEGVLAMGETLKFNNTLVELNLGTNHINNEGINMLCKGLDFNENIKILCLSNNPVTVDGAIRLLEVVRKNDKSNLENININNVLVNENFMELLKSVTHDHPQFVIETRGVGGSIVGSQKSRPDPMKVIQDYLDKHKLRLSDFFRNMDKAGNMNVPVSDFKKALQQFNIPLDLVQVEELLSKLDRGNTGSIDYRNLVDTRKRMIRHQREQLHKEETRQRKEKQKSQWVLKTLNSAMKAITPRSSIVIVPGQIKLPAIQPLKSFSSQQLSGTSLSSWHHVEMSNSSQYSVPILNNIQLHRPVSHLVSAAKLGSSVKVNSVSQPDLLLKSPVTPQTFDLESDPVTKSSPPTSFLTAQAVISGHKTRELKTKM
ncbi:uncharacterized protein LOC125455513 [Stegostoma tigrinum]|uniref:uncharacterized protein LOC125455513 n=1 Tax=Stegostoma tigrinum TaxID=3053191 RepID=UPI0028701133|nr:uncharacterized protein LOC125455513 [Stegostoma tigrinum]